MPVAVPVTPGSAGGKPVRCRTGARRRGPSLRCHGRERARRKPGDGPVTVGQHAAGEPGDGPVTGGSVPVARLVTVPVTVGSVLAATLVTVPMAAGSVPAAEPVTELVTAETVLVAGTVTAPVTPGSVLAVLRRACQRPPKACRRTGALTALAAAARWRRHLRRCW